MPLLAESRDTPLAGDVGADSLRIRLARGVAWNVLGTTFNQGSTFVANVLLANILGVRLFGEYAMVQSTVGVVSTVGQLATGYTATKYVAEFRTGDRRRASRLLALLSLISVAMGALATVALLISAGWMSLHLLHEPGLAPVLRIAACGVAFMVMNGLLMGALAGLERYGSLGRIGVLSGSLYLAAALAGVFVAGLRGCVAGVAISALLQWLMLLWAVIREAGIQGIRLEFASVWTEREILVRFAIPAALNGLVSMPAIWFGYALLAGQPGGYILLALFTAANNFRIIVLFLPNIVNNVSMSLINHQKGLRNDVTFKRVFWVNLAATVITVILAAGGIAGLGPWLLAVYGREFSAGYAILLVLMAATVPESVSLAMLQIIQSRERLWMSFVAMALPCYGTLALSAWLLVPSMGGLGLAWAYLSAWTVGMVGTIMIVSKLGIRLTGEPRLLAGV